MCGIAGFVGNTEPESARVSIKRMCDVIEHRGPDDEGYHVGKNVALGMRRLAIIDLATGHQPISNEDGTIWIVFNGEIYNHRELRRDLVKRGHVFSTESDTETIVHLYEEVGDRLVERLRGMFVFAIWDQRENRLFMARDRVGKKPLHYAFVRNTFIFGSEIKSLLQHPDVSREVNLKAISDFLSFGYVPDPETAFQDILKLPPGCVLTLKDNRLQTYRYWDFDYSGQPSPGPLHESDYVERLRELLAEAVKVRLESEVPLGAFLSGGVDSTAVVALMTRFMERPVKTFSIGFNVANYDELAYARIAARHLGTEHYEFVVTPDVCKLVEEIVWHHDEPFADVSSIPMYVVAKTAREHVTVVLSGDGGDEVFGGYDRYRVDSHRRIFDYLGGSIPLGWMQRMSRVMPRWAYGKNFLRNASLPPAARYVDSLSFFNEDAKSDLLSSVTCRALGKHNSADAFTKLYGIPASTDRLDHLLYLDSKTYLPGDILTKVDRMTMAHSIEARVPLLDHKLIEFAETIPASLKMLGGESKWILKKAVGHLVPKEIIDRPKKGFSVPLGHWFNGELRELLYDTLTDQRTRQRGLFNPTAVLRVLDEHARRRRNNASQLWELLTLELWHREFIDKRPSNRFAGAKRTGLEAPLLRTEMMTHGALT